METIVRLAYIAILGLSLSILVVDISANLRSSYQEACNKTQKCNSRIWLGCFDGVCDCIKQDQMKFDSVKMKCISKLGERCKFGLEGTENSHLFEFTECVDHAHCNSVGNCVCDTNYHETSDGSCRLAGTHGEKCSDVDKCSETEKLKCIDGTCKCDDEDSAFSTETLSCVGVSEKPCLNNNCIQGAECALEGKCVCLPHHYHNSADKLCYKTKDIFQQCSANFECMQKPGLELRCLEGVCDCGSNLKYDTIKQLSYSCPHGDYTCISNTHNRQHYEYNFYYVYNSNPTTESSRSKGEKISRCVPLVGHACPDGYCLSNAKCYPRLVTASSDVGLGNSVQQQHLTAECKCLEGYIGNKKNTSCVGNHGKDCQSSTECMEGLECVNQVCSCPMPSRQHFFGPQKACLTAVGGHCTNDSLCEEHSFCNLISGMCECKEGFIANNNGHCEVEFGGKCSHETDCDSMASLSCVDNVCTCGDKMYKFSPLLRKCLGLVGAPCIVINNDIVSNCTVNAYCSKYQPNNLSGPGQCKCRDGFIQATDYSC